MTRARLGTIALLVVLASIAAAFWRLHDIAWPGQPTASRLLGAAALLGAYVLLCSWWLRGARQPRDDNTAATATTLVVWASQTGLACELAGRSAAMLRDAGQPCALLPLEQLDSTRLEQASTILFLVSTSGEGDAPDHATGFVNGVMRGAPDLARLRYGLLALGDRSYGNFCAFGQRLDHWLDHAGAHALFDRVEVDNASPDALRHWQHLLGHLVEGAATAPDWERPRYARWRLDQRRLLNPGSAGGPVHHLSLSPIDAALPHWRAGDITEVGPRHPARRVQRWLDAHGLDGNVIIDGEPLRAHLSRSRLPQDDAITDPMALVAALVALPHREYSIASIPDDGHLDLLLRLHLDVDNQPGLGSGWLCLHASTGDEIALRVRSNPAFHGPARAAPLILIGNGTGIAGLRALLRERIAGGARRNWLLFGERNRAHDLHFGDELQAWHADGWLTRIDLAFSRDPDAEHRYVQHALRAAADVLRAWVADGAVIQICGSLRGMAPDVDQALHDILGAQLRESLLAAGRYRRDVY